MKTLLKSAEKNARLTVKSGEELTILDLYPPDVAFDRAIAIAVSPNATLNWIRLQNFEPHIEHTERITITALPQATVNTFFAHLGGARIDDTTVIELQREASANHHTVYFGRGKERMHINVTVRHFDDASMSVVTSKGALQDEARANFKGLIDIQPNIKGASGDLFEHTLLLSDRANIEALPALEIGSHDVRATHAASMERVDEEKLFYATSRGIDEKEAIRLIVEGFLTEAIEPMPVAKAKSLLRETIRERIG